MKSSMAARRLSRNGFTGFPLKGTPRWCVLPSKVIAFVILLWIFVLPVQATAHEDTTSIGIDEKLGEFVPLDLLLNGEDGTPVRLRELVDRPTIIGLIYFACPNVCPRLIAGMGSVLSKVKADPNTDYRALTISFDENDTPEIAREKKHAYMNLVPKDFPETSWRFLTADAQTIHDLTDAVGFRFVRDGNEFKHAVALIILSPEGKIVRYLYGDEFLPFDLKMALLEASEGRVGTTAAKALLYCFSYDPAGKKYVFNIMRIYGTAITVFAVIFFIFLMRRGRKGPGDG